MTREEAIKRLIIIKSWEQVIFDDYAEAMDMAIHALYNESLETKQATSDKVSDCDNCIWNVCNYNKVDWECDDCISREQAVYVASGYCHPANIADELRKLPSVTPKGGLTNVL